MQNSPDLWKNSWPRRKYNCHKYDNGHVLCISDSLEKAGAIRLAAKASLRIGAGLVSIACNITSSLSHAAQINEIMLKIFADEKALREILADKSIKSIIIGPGLEQCDLSKKLVLTALSTNKPIVLDGGVFSLFSESTEELFTLVKHNKAPVIMTPHAGEFKKIFGKYNSDKIAATIKAAKISGAIIVHKGADSIIVAPDTKYIINNNASPNLATAGSGDVLAGMIAGLLAQGMDGWLASAAACYLHGQAGMDIGVGLIASDIIDALPNLMRGIIFK